MGVLSWIFGKKAPEQQAAPVQAKMPEKKEKDMQVILFNSEQIRILEELRDLVNVLGTELEDAVANIPNRFKMLVPAMKAEISLLLNEKKMQANADSHLKDIINSFVYLVNAYKNYTILESIFDNIGRKILEFEKSVGLTESIYKKKITGK